MKPPKLNRYDEEDLNLIMIRAIFDQFPRLNVGESFAVHKWLAINAPSELPRFYDAFNWPVEKVDRYVT